MNRIPVSLDRMLRRVHRRRRGMAAAASALAGMAAGLAAMLGAVALDAMLPLPPAGLAVADLALASLAIAGAAAFVRRLARDTYSPEATALLVHERLSIPGGGLINAVDLSVAPPPGASAALVDLAIRRGEADAAGVDPSRVVGREGLRRPARLALAAAIVAAVAAAWVPQAFRAVIPRLLHPGADLPPFTRLRFEVDVSPEALHVGQDAAIRVRVTGPGLPAEASVVFPAADGSRPRSPMWREMTPASPAAPVEAVFALRLESLDGSRSFYIDTPGGRSAGHRIEVSRRPLVERVTLWHRPPAYTAWPPVAERLGPSGIRAFQGTTVGVACRANVPLAGGRLTLRPGADAPAEGPAEVALVPDPADPRSVTGTVGITRSGTFEITVTGVDGLPGDAILGGAVVCTPDQPPRVAVVEPDPVSIAPEGWKAPVRIEAGDDVGLASIDLRARVDDTPFRPLPLTVKADGHATTQEASHSLDLAALGARAGHVVRYFALARDNRPDGGQTAETPVQTLHVISMEEYRNIARAGYHLDSMIEEWAAFRMAVDRLALERAEVLRTMDELEASRRERGGPSSADRPQMQALENALREYARQADDLADEMRRRTEAVDLYDAEVPYKDRLRELASALERQGTDASTLGRALAGLSGPEGGAPPDLTPAAEAFRANDAPFTRDVASDANLAGDLDRIGKASKLSFQASRLQDVIDRQRDLSDRLSAASDPLGLGEAASRPRLESLGREQGRLETELRETVAALARTASECRNDLPHMAGSAEELASAARDLAAWNDQASAAAACPGNARTAARHAEAAARKLETLLTGCQGVGQAGGQELDRGLSLCRNQGMSSVRQMTQGWQTAMRMGMIGQGGAGRGMAGTMATVGMVGPHVPGGTPVAEGRGGTPRSERAPGSPASLESGGDAAGADAVHAESSLENSADARQLPGVPSAYRDLAEAYFRRLARDAAGAGGSAGKPMEPPPGKGTKP